jgi:transposase-like protein
MNKTRRKHSGTFKTKVVLDMLKETQTLAQLSGKHGVHASQMTKWKKVFLENAIGIFSDSSNGNGNSKEKSRDKLENELYKKIGQLQMELDWLKKKSETLI